MNKLLVSAACAAVALMGCNNAQDRAEDRMEAQAEANAAASGSAIAALGLTETQLLRADLVDASGAELGDVEAVVRGANGQVEGLVVEIEDSNPDRFVQVPVTGLNPVIRANDTDIATTRTAAELAALPNVDLTAR